MVRVTIAGIGIGLAIVKKGIERMGGRVAVESRLDAGSAFCIDLPAPQEGGTQVS